MGLYVGLTAIVERSKKKMLEFIKERVKIKIKEWKSNFLSLAGKEVMLKSICFAIPLYALPCSQSSANLCKENATIFTDFLWDKLRRKGKCTMKNGRSFGRKKQKEFLILEI